MRRCRNNFGREQKHAYDQSIRACKSVLDQGFLGDSVFASIDMQPIPHWMPWQEELGWVTLRTMSIHHLDSLSYLFGDLQRVFASVSKDPRTLKKFDHEDGIALYILEYANGFRASVWDDVWTGPSRGGVESDIYINWRVEGTEGMAKGTIGWPLYPEPTPNTLRFHLNKISRRMDKTTLERSVVSRCFCRAPWLNCFAQ